MPKILLAVHPKYYGPILEQSVVDELATLGECEQIGVDWSKAGSKEYRADFAARIAASNPEILVICWDTPKLTAETHAKTPNLKYLVNLAGTVRGLVDRECIEKGLLVSNWGTVIARTIAEAALMMILGALRRVTTTQFHMHVRKGWRRSDVRPMSLFERRVGLHGLGGIARELVTLLKPFGCRIESYSPHAPDETFERLGVVRQPSLRDLYATNDVVSVHAGLTPETRGMVSKDILASMKDGAVLVNTARGAVIDEGALAAELQSGRIHAALDVFEREPPPEDSPLRGLENCMLVPHDAGPTDDRKVDMGRLGLRNLKRYLAGEEPEFVVTLERYDLST